MIASVPLGILLGFACLLLLSSPWPYLAPLVVLGLFGVALLYQRPTWGFLGIYALVPFEGLFKSSVFSGAKLLGASLIMITLYKLLLRQISAIRLKSNLWPALLLFLLCLLLNLMYSENRSVSLDSLRELAVGLALFFVTLLVGNEINTLQLCRLLSVSVAITCVVAMVSVDHQVGGRAIGLLQDANYFALLIAMAVPLAIFLTQYATRWPMRLFWGCVALTLVISIIKTDSRSGLLVVLLIIAIGAWHSRAQLKRLEPRHLGFLMLAVAVIVPLVIATLPAKYVERINSLSMLQSGASSSDPSLGRRSSYLIVGGQMISDSPLLGAGLGSFPFHYAQTGFASEFSENMNEIDLYRRAHNTYLEIFSELGVPGGLCFVSLIIIGLRNFERTRLTWLLKGQQTQADIATHLGLSLLAMAIFLLFLSAPNHKYLWIFLALSSVLRRQADGWQARP